MAKEYTWEQAAALLREYLEADTDGICSCTEWVDAAWKMVGAAKLIRQEQETIRAIEDVAVKYGYDKETGECLVDWFDKKLKGGRWPDLRKHSPDCNCVWCRVIQR